MVKKINDVKIPQIILEIKKENLSSNGGAGVLFNSIFRKLGFEKNLKRISIKKRNRGYSDLCYLMSMISNFFSGGFGLNTMDVLENDENFRNIIGLKQVPDPSSVGEYLRCFDKNSLDNLNREMVKILKVILNSLKKNTYTYNDWLYGFIDGSLLETSSKREGTEIRDRNGNRSLLFMPFYLDEFLANMVLVGGNKHESGFIRELLEPYEGLLKKYKFHLFLDSAYYSKENVESCLDAKGYYYTITVNKFTDALERIAAELPEASWKEVDAKKYFGGKYESVEVGDLEYWAQTWSYEHRYVVARCRRRNELIHLFHFILTNREDLNAEEVLELHKIKNGLENNHKNLLNDMALHHPPMQKLSANNAYYLLAAIAHNIMHGIKKLMLPVKYLSSRTRTLIHKVMKTPARVIKHAGKVIVRLEEILLSTELLEMFKRFHEWYPLLR